MKKLRLYPLFRPSLVLLFLLTALSPTLSGQGPIYMEDFESPNHSFVLNTSALGGATAGFNDWAVNNAYTGGTGTLICLGFPFTFTVNNSPTQPAAITNSPNSTYMHMLADNAVLNNILNANYQPADGTCQGSESNFSGMGIDISTAGLSGVTFSFWWMGVGSATSYGEVYYSTNSGTSWIQLTAPISQYNNQSTWTQQSITNPAFDNQATLRFGFRFVNNISTTGADPAFSVDQIEVTGTGCSAVSTNLSVDICDGDSAFAGGAFQTQTGIYTDSLLNSQGCDSIVTTNLTVNPTPVVFSTASICEGDSIFIGGAFQTTAGTYTDAFTTAAGCDSTEVTTLVVNPTYSNTSSLAICEGDSVFLGGSFQTTAGTYTDAFTTAAGCDSTEITVLTVNPAPQTNDAAAICEGDSILLGGSFQTQAGTYVDVLQTAEGCDSTVTTTLTVNTVDTSVTFLSGVLTANASPASYQWIDCNSNMPISGETGQSYTVTQSGSFAVEVTENGCTATSSCWNLVIENSAQPSVLDQVSIFPNPVEEDLQVDLGGVRVDLRLSVVNALGQVLLQQEHKATRSLHVTLSDLPAGIYLLQLESGREAKTFRIVKN